MDLIYIIKETSLMMGFTFIVGILFAYVLKLMTFLFTGLSAENSAVLLRKVTIWGRAYRMDIAHSYRYIRSVTRIEGEYLAGMHLDPDAKDADHAMDGLAEYHLGNLNDASGQDAEMTRLFELHHGKI